MEKRRARLRGHLTGCAASGIAAACMTLALLAQFSSEGAHTRYELILPIFAACLAALRYCVSHVNRREAIASLAWGSGLSLAFLIGVTFKTESGGPASLGALDAALAALFWHGDMLRRRDGLPDGVAAALRRA